jgi:hypothetical protein
MPVSSSDGAPERNTRRLECIAAQPEGPARDFVIEVCVLAAAGAEEPENYQTLIDAIGAEAIARAFPAGVPGQPIADVRSRARARTWLPAPGSIDPIMARLRAQIAIVPETRTETD